MYDDPGLFQYDGGIVRDILRDDTIGTDPDIVTDTDVTDDLGTAADVHIVTNDRGSVAPAIRQGVGADGYLMEDHTVFADLRIAGNENSGQTVGEGR